MTDDIEKRKSKIDEITGTSDDTASDVESKALKKKDERMQKQLITAWMRKRAIMYTVIVALAIVITISVAVLVKNSIKKGNSEDPDVSGVLVIDGEIISQEEFLFFCSMVIESDTFENMSVSDNNIARLSDNVKTVAVKNAEEFIGKVHESKKLGVTLTEKEISDIASSIELAAKNYKNKDEYCSKFYGMGYEDYFNFRKQVVLVSKGVSALADKADIGEEKQKAVYSECPEEFVELGVKMIYMDIRGLDEKSISDKRSNAETLLHYVTDGLDIGELSETHSDENDLFNVAEHESAGSVILNKNISDDYRSLYDASFDINVGEVKLIETENEICIVQCVEKTTVEDVLNTEELINYVKKEYVSEYFDTIISTGKYSAVVNNDLYLGVDITSYVERARLSYIQEAK